MELFHSQNMDCWAVLMPRGCHESLPPSYRLTSISHPHINSRQVRRSLVFAIHKLEQHPGILLLCCKHLGCPLAGVCLTIRLCAISRVKHVFRITADIITAHLQRVRIPFQAAAINYGPAVLCNPYAGASATSHQA